MRVPPPLAREQLGRSQRSAPGFSMKSAKVVLEERAAGLVICVRGEVDLSNAEDLRAAILPEIPDAGPGVVLDLTEVTYLDSSGIRLLFDLADRVQSQGQHLVLAVSDTALVRRVVVLTKLEQAVPIVESVGDALDALASR